MTSTTTIVASVLPSEVTAAPAFYSSFSASPSSDPSEPSIVGTSTYFDITPLSQISSSSIPSAYPTAISSEPEAVPSASKVTIIIGIIFGTLFAITLAFTLILCHRRQSQLKRERNSQRAKNAAYAYSLAGSASRLGTPHQGESRQGPFATPKQRARSRGNKSRLGFRERLSHASSALSSTVSLVASAAVKGKGKSPASTVTNMTNMTMPALPVYNAEQMAVLGVMQQAQRRNDGVFEVGDNADMIHELPASPVLLTKLATTNGGQDAIQSSSRDPVSDVFASSSRNDSFNTLASSSRADMSVTGSSRNRSLKRTPGPSKLGNSARKDGLSRYDSSGRSTDSSENESSSRYGGSSIRSRTGRNDNFNVVPSSSKTPPRVLVTSSSQRSTSSSHSSSIPAPPEHDLMPHPLRISPMYPIIPPPHTVTPHPESQKLPESLMIRRPPKAALASPAHTPTPRSRSSRARKQKQMAARAAHVLSWAEQGGENLDLEGLNESLAVGSPSRKRISRRRAPPRHVEDDDGNKTSFEEHREIRPDHSWL
jgi:hypothetical protein